MVAALKDSTILDIVDNDTCVQRKVPLPEDIKDKPVAEVQKVFEDAAMARSVYVKGFGEEEPSTQFDIEAFFAPHGPTNSVRLRRDPTRSFKGSVFVEFDSEATQKAFLALDPQPKWKGQDLQIKSKKQYCDEKVEDISAGRIRPNISGGREKHDRPNRKDCDDRDWNTRRDEDRKNGFRDDRRGGHKGFGSSGQRGRGRGGGGRGGGRGDRGPRDRNEERARDREEQYVPPLPFLVISVETSRAANGTPTSAVPNIATTSANPATESAAPDSSTADTPSKKRAREDNDDGAADQGAAKKVDIKEEQS